MKKIVIIGSSGFAKEVAFLLEEINRVKKDWQLLGFIDDKTKVVKGPYQIIGDDEWLANTDNHLHVAFGIGDPVVIKKLYNKFKENSNLIFPNLFHPKIIGDWDKIIFGEGNIVTAGVIMTTDIRIGNCNIFNLSCTVGHDCIIGNYNVFNPTVNLSGGLIIEDSILIGTGAQVLQYKRICSNSTLGAGAVLTKDILESGVYVGSPAKKLIK